jgi:hypothetical protein
MAETPFSRVVDKIGQNLAPYSVAVAFEQKLWQNDQDGDTWAMLAFDGSDSETLTVSLSGTERAKLSREIDADDIEHAVEHRAGAYPLETRLADLATHGELVLTADELNRFT